MVKKKVKVAYGTDGYDRVKQGRSEHVRKYDKQIELPQLSKEQKERIKSGIAPRIAPTISKGPYERTYNRLSKAKDLLDKNRVVLIKQLNDLLTDIEDENGTKIDLNDIETIREILLEKYIKGKEPK